MVEHYIYKGEPVERAFGAIAEGDYNYIIAECGEPYFKNDKWILAVKLIIEPSKIYVFANPWSGKTSAGEERDGIADLLVSCNRAPRPGARPDWKAVIGARGRCRLKVEIAQLGALAGKEINRVAWFHRPKELNPAGESAESFSNEEVAHAQKDVLNKAQGATTKADEEPDDIPF